MKKFLRIIWVFIFLVINGFFLFALGGCWTSTDENGFVFNLLSDRKEYEVYAGDKFNVNYTDVVIPATHKGKPVTKIKENGFRSLYPLSFDGLGVGNTNNVKSIRLPSTINVIGEGAFYGCNLETITAESGIFKSDNNCLVEIATNTLVLGIKTSVIPDYVERIGTAAFLGCVGLEDIVIPSSVTSIAYGAFIDSGIWNDAPDDSVVYVDRWAVGYKGFLESPLSIQPGTVGIGESAFRDLESAEEIVLADSVKYICAGAFYNSRGIKRIELSSSTITIGMSAFAHCYDLENIMIPASVLRIDDYAFGYCMKLPSIAIPSSVTNIGVGVFAGCGGMESIEVEVNNSVFKSQGNCLIESATNKLIAGCQKSIIPAYVVEIGECAFMQIPEFRTIAIPSSVVKIGDRAFYNCATLRDLVIPSSVKCIGSNAFFHCDLLSIVIPESVIELGENVFYNSFITIYVEAESKPQGWSKDWNKDNAPVVWGYKK